MPTPSTSASSAASIRRPAALAPSIRTSLGHFNSTLRSDGKPATSAARTASAAAKPTAVAPALWRDAGVSAGTGRAPADARDAAGRALVGKTVDVAFDSDPKSTRTVDFLGYAYTRTPSSVVE